MTEHSFSPWDPYAVERDLPKDPVLQTVGEVLTADEVGLYALFPPLPIIILWCLFILKHFRVSYVFISLSL